jgi:hypothetical protein
MKTVEVVFYPLRFCRWNDTANLLKILSWVQPDKNPWEGTGPRDVFRHVAREFHDARTSLRQLAIRHQKFMCLVKLLISQHLLSEGQTETLIRPVDLNAAATAVLKAFTHDSKDAIIWHNFDEAYTHKTVRRAVCAMKFL